MKKHQSYYLIFILILSSLWSLVSAQDLFRNTLTGRDGLSQNDARCILQDKQGFIWIGTTDGLNRYDGYDFKIYRPIDSRTGLVNRRITTISENSDGIIWFGTAEGNVFRINPETENVIKSDSLCNALKFDENVVKIIHLRYHTFIFTSNKILLVNKASLKTNFYNPVNFKNTEAFHAAVKVSDGKLYVASKRGEIFTIEDASESTRIKTEHIFSDNIILVKEMCYLEGNLFIAAKDALFCLNENNKIIKVAPIESKSITVDNNGIVWGANDTCIYKLKNNTKKKFKIDSVLPFGNQGEGIEIRCVFSDIKGTIWLGTNGAGVIQINSKKNKFKLFQNLEKDRSIAHGPINVIRETSKGDLWIGMRGNGISVLGAERSKDYLKGFKSIEPLKLKGWNIKNIYEIKTNKGSEVFVTALNKPMLVFSKKGMQSKREDALYKTLNKYAGYMTAIKQDGDNIWFGAYGSGLFRYSLQSEELKSYKKTDIVNQSISGFITYLFTDSNGDLWIGTDAGLNMLPVSEKQKPQPNFVNYFYNPTDSTGLNNQFIMPIFETSDHIMIFGTMGGGLNILDNKTGTFDHITIEDGLIGNIIKGILEDEHKNLWVSTNKGISKVNIKTREIYNFNVYDGLQDQEFSDYACLKRKDGEMIFGGANGFNTFYPKDITIDTVPPIVVLTGLDVLHKTINPGEEKEGKAILKKAINQTKEITLKANENSFTISFAGLHFENPLNVRYKYKLEGFDEVYTEVPTTARFAKYTNIPPGTYVFKVNAAIGSGSWNNREKTLKIIVLAPWYRTGYALIGYFLLIILILLLTAKIYSTRVRMEDAIKRERFEKNKIKELSQYKLQFFTNISHEFRTPLTLIKLCFDELLKVSTKDQKEKYDGYLETGNRNIQVLLQLINQLIDFRKLEQGKISLEKKVFNVSEFINPIFNSFKILALKQEIDFSMVISSGPIELFADPEQIEKVIYNLLSNAFKYTPRNGKIRLEIGTESEFVLIRVSDSGIGISESALSSIFDRFYRATKFENTNIGSAGIGLSLAKGLIELHEGKIDVESRVGEGTTFAVSLPLISPDTPREEVSVSSFSDNSYLDNYVIEEQVSDEEDEITTEIATILVVEDNPDLKAMLVEGFSKRYKVLDAENGLEGLNICHEKNPDLVISDVMMPIKNGLELCNDLKNDIATSHIPVILLTAKTLDEYVIEGYESGADAYVCKPFSFDVLQSQVKAILKSRELIQSKYRTTVKIPESLTELGALDNDFMNKVKTAIEENISNPEFSVTKLAEDCNVSERLLYKKIKAITGDTPLTIMRQQRLFKASELLKTDNGTLMEIMDSCGFANYNHFSSLFKKEYGLTPGEYRKKWSSGE